ncbi:MAG: permease [Aestuariivirga sp.]
MSADWRTESKPLLILVAVFAACYALPTDSARFQGAVMEGLHLVKWYAQEHMALCVVPALFIAGAIGVFVSQGAVMRYLGAGANRFVAYGVASVSGSVLAVCSCTVLPLFAGIYKRGAGLGPAAAFLYAGPAINVLAIILTARILGMELGVARVVGAVGFSVVVGAIMHLIYRREEAARAADAPPAAEAEAGRPLGQTMAFFAAMIAILVFANWAPSKASVGWWDAIHAAKWWISGGLAVAFAIMLVRWYGMAWWKLTLLGAAVLVTALVRPDLHELAFSVGTIGLGWLASRSEGEMGDWFDQTWGFTKQIVPLLLGGVLVAGILLGRPGHEGLIPSEWVASAVGGNGLLANFISSLAGAFMYFATLTELPILEGLMGSGMGKGPALALLLAGPALSLPSMLVLRSIMGAQKTVVFVALVVVMATLTGWVFGLLFP